MGEPFEDGVASILVAPAVTAEGQEVVLKVQKPHRESEHEAAALELWDGDGAVRLLDDEPGDYALLLERCVPGTPLSAVEAMELLLSRMAKTKTNQDFLASMSNGKS